MAADSGRSNQPPTDSAPPAPEAAQTVSRRARFRVVSKHQVSGWRFLLSRIEHALVRRDPSMLDDPARGRMTALLVGVALACVCIAAAAVLSFFKPAKVVGNSKIVADKDSGALYVNIDGRLYPALNLSSARLIVGSSDNPVQVPSDELSKYPRGPWVGIPGAPGRMVGTSDRNSYWAVCDTARTGHSAPLDPSTGLPTAAASPVLTTAIGGKLTVDGDAVRDLGDSEARLVREGTTNWLVYRHPERGVVRAMINMGDAAVLLAVGVDAIAPVVIVSRGLLEAIPEVPPLTPPKIEGAGAEVVLSSGYTTKIGAILAVATPDRPAAYYVVTQPGLLPVSPVLAAMIRNADVLGSPASATVSANTIAANLRSGTLPAASTYPVKPVELVDPTEIPVTCYGWSHRDGDPTASTTLLVGKNLPLTADERRHVVNLVSGQFSGGESAHSVYLPKTSGRFVQVTGSDAVSPRRESLWWVSDSGVRYGIDVKVGDSGAEQTLNALGIGSPVPAPWSVISLFAPGPTLSRADARLQHDGIAPDQLVAKIPDN